MDRMKTKNASMLNSKEAIDSYISSKIGKKVCVWTPKNGHDNFVILVAYDGERIMTEDNKSISVYFLGPHQHLDFLKE